MSLWARFKIFILGIIVFLKIPDYFYLLGGLILSPFLIFFSCVCVCVCVRVRVRACARARACVRACGGFYGGGGGSRSRSHSICTYNYTFNRCLSPLKLWVRIPDSDDVCSKQHYVMKFVSDLRQVDGFPSGIPVTFTNKTDRHDITETWFESGVKHHYLFCILLCFLCLFYSFFWGGGAWKSFVLLNSKSIRSILADLPFIILD